MPLRPPLCLASPALSERPHVDLTRGGSQWCQMDRLHAALPDGERAGPGARSDQVSLSPVRAVCSGMAELSGTGGALGRSVIILSSPVLETM